MENNYIAPGNWLGLMGGGQLGKMFAQAAATLGYRVCVLEPDKNAPAAAVSLQHIIAPYTEPMALEELASHCKAVTTEFENVPAEALSQLGKTIPCCPDASAVRITQDRFDEKSFVKSTGAPVAPHALIQSDDDCKNVDASLFPGILKTARLGYDGKGQINVDTPEELTPAFEKLGKVRCVLEKKLPLEKEVSVIVVRNKQGEIKTFPVCENQHKNGILATTILPARISQELADNARKIASVIAEKLNYQGVLCCEMFVLQGGELVVNELAPRPHNSGHCTIEACVCSQYEQQVRALAGLPLGSTEQVSFAVMLNILGDVWFDQNGDMREPNWPAVLKIDGAKLHLYGKKEPRKARKMGHVTCIGKTPEDAMAVALKVCPILNLPLPQ